MRYKEFSSLIKYLEKTSNSRESQKRLDNDIENLKILQKRVLAAKQEITTHASIGDL